MRQMKMWLELLVIFTHPTQVCRILPSTPSYFHGLPFSWTPAGSQILEAMLRFPQWTDALLSFQKDTWILLRISPDA